MRWIKIFEAQPATGESRFKTGSIKLHRVHAVRHDAWPDYALCGFDVQTLWNEKILTVDVNGSHNFDVCKACLKASQGCCETCNGTGTVIDEENWTDRRIKPWIITCSWCLGTGKP